MHNSPFLPSFSETMGNSETTLFSKKLLNIDHMQKATDKLRNHHFLTLHLSVPQNIKRQKLDKQIKT